MADDSTPQQPAEAAANAPPASEPIKAPEPQKPNHKPLIIVGVIVFAVFIVIMAIGAVIITQLKNTITTINAIKNVSQAQSSSHSAETYASESAVSHSSTSGAKADSYVDLDTATVNLKSEDGDAHFLQLKMTLTIADEKLSEVIKKRLPEIRSRMIMLLSTYTATTLGTEKGKQELSDNITIAINQILEPQSPTVQKAMRELQKPEPDSEALRDFKINLPVKNVLFSSFFIQ